MLDVGWSSRELGTAAGTQHWLVTSSVQVDVLVTRSHGLALGQTERALAELESETDLEQVIVIVVRAERRSRRELLAAGSRLRHAHQQGSVLFAPTLSTRALPGLGPETLPKPLAAVARQVLERIKARPPASPGPTRPPTPVPRFPMDEVRRERLAPS